MINDYIIEIFRDQLPYEPTEEQEFLISGLVDFMLNKNEESLFLLQGYAGTGKTSLIGAFVKVLLSLKQKVNLLAPTGRAAKIFSGYAGHPAYTIHKKIYRQKSFSADYEGFQVADNLYKDTFFIVDEASMVANSTGDSVAYGSGRLLDDLVEYVYSGSGCRLILLGDVAQLPPVGQLRSPALDLSVLEGFGFPVYKFEMTQVVRQAEKSGILFNATRLRKQMFSSSLSVPKLSLAGYSDISSVRGDEMIDLINAAYDRDGTDETIVITRSNKRANIFNQGIRNQILYREEELVPGDLLLISKNNYFWSQEYKEIDFIANGDVARVIKLRGTRELYGFRFADVLLYFPDYEVEMDVRIILDTLTTEAPALPVEMNNLLFTTILEDYEDIPSKREKYKKLKSDPYFNALQVKYAYAVTCHKAQGGQWKNVFVDMSYINPDHLGIDFYRWLYTALTRSTEHLYLVNIGDDYVEAPKK